jgi:16S rRNA (cytidine1402-2'-O)-methyltransferase
MQQDKANTKPGQLHLIPSFLGEVNLDIIPDSVKHVINSIDEFIVEDARTARRYLRAIGYTKNFDTEVTIHELDKHTQKHNFKILLKNVLCGTICGVISEAGNPCIADPGNEIVAFAHKHNIEVIPHVGPSSILLALIASGFSGQRFTFNGYLPIREPERGRKIKQLENLAKSNFTQIFMETPFRNDTLLAEVIKQCHDDTLLSIACDLTLPTQYIKTKTIASWRKHKPELHKRFCIFVLG